MANQGGIDFGTRQTCRVCQYDRFYVEIGTGTRDGEAICVRTERCAHCGTPEAQFQVDYLSAKGADITIDDGVRRETDVPKKEELVTK